MSELSRLSGISRVHRAYDLLLYAHDFYTKRSRSHDEDALNTQQYSCTFSLGANEQCFALFEDAAKLDTVVACIGPTTGFDLLDSLQAYALYNFGNQPGGDPTKAASFSKRVSSVPYHTLVNRLNAGWSVTLCGHSFGGAVANIVCQRMLAASADESDGWGNLLACVTFGSPQVFDENYGSAFSQVHFRRLFHHVVSAGDVIARTKFETAGNIDFSLLLEDRKLSLSVPCDAMPEITCKAIAEHFVRAKIQLMVDLDECDGEYYLTKAGEVAQWTPPCMQQHWLASYGTLLSTMLPSTGAGALLRCANAPVNVDQGAWMSRLVPEACTAKILQALDGQRSLYIMLRGEQLDCLSEFHVAGEAGRDTNVTAATVEACSSTVVALVVPSWPAEMIDGTVITCSAKSIFDGFKNVQVDIAIEADDASRSGRMNVCMPDVLMFCACLLRLCRPISTLFHQEPFQAANLSEILSIGDIVAKPAGDRNLLLEEVALARFLSGRMCGNNSLPPDRVSSIVRLPRKRGVLTAALLGECEAEINAKRIETGVLASLSALRLPSSGEQLKSLLASTPLTEDAPVAMIGRQGVASALNLPAVMSDWETALVACDAAVSVHSDGSYGSDDATKADEELRTRYLMSALASTQLAAIRACRSPLHFRVTSKLESEWLRKAAGTANTVVDAALTAGSAIARTLFAGWPSAALVAAGALAVFRAVREAAASYIQFNISVMEEVYPLRIHDIYKALSPLSRRILPTEFLVHSISQIEKDIVRIFFERSDGDRSTAPPLPASMPEDAVGQYNKCVGPHFLTTGGETDATKTNMTPIAVLHSSC
jgi:hypothetical protein